jgi:hypothetical protein
VIEHVGLLCAFYFLSLVCFSSAAFVYSQSHGCPSSVSVSFQLSTPSDGLMIRHKYLHGRRFDLKLDTHVMHVSRLWSPYRLWLRRRTNFELSCGVDRGPYKSDDRLSGPLNLKTGKIRSKVFHPGQRYGRLKSCISPSMPKLNKLIPRSIIERTREVRISGDCP